MNQCNQQYHVDCLKQWHVAGRHFVDVWLQARHYWLDQLIDVEMLMIDDGADSCDDEDCYAGSADQQDDYYLKQIHY